jgi:hypothetical protein
MSLNLDSQEADLDQIWSDYYGLVKKDEQETVFNLYLGRDMKENNIRLIIGKSIKLQFENSVQNLEKYCDKFDLDLLEAERIFCRLLAFKNNR